MIEKIKVCFDIDGCMNNFHHEVQTILNEDYDIILSDNEADWAKYIEKVEDLDKFWALYNNKIEKNMLAEEDCKFVLQKLRQLGCPINITTAREYYAAAITEKWLTKEELQYDNIYFNCNNKVDVCKWLGAKLVIEDSPMNALALADNSISVLLFSRTYNKDVKHPNIIHCDSWLDIYEIISNIIKKRFIFRR